MLNAVQQTELPFVKCYLTLLLPIYILNIHQEKVDNYEVKSSEIELKIELRHRKRYGLDREKHFQCGPAVFVERNRISYEFQFQKKKVF